jgi:hypothetical protein
MTEISSNVMINAQVVNAWLTTKTGMVHSG